VATALPAPPPQSGLRSTKHFRARWKTGKMLRLPLQPRLPEVCRVLAFAETVAPGTDSSVVTSYFLKRIDQIDCSIKDASARQCRDRIQLRRIRLTESNGKNWYAQLKFRPVLLMLLPGIFEIGILSSLIRFT